MKQKIILAFSGGSDSTFLLETIYHLTSQIFHVAFFQTPFSSLRTAENAYKFLESRGFNYTILPLDLLKEPDVVANQPDRCYHCKKAMFEALLKYFNLPGVLPRFMEGTNFSEALHENRPGLRAIEELKIESPLRRAGMTDEDIAVLREEHHFHPPIDDIGCLATRIPYGTPITIDLLKRIDEAEEFLREKDFHKVRIRYMGDTAKIEVAQEELPRLVHPPFRNTLVDHLKGVGFKHVYVDMEGYRPGAFDDYRSSS